MGFWNTERVERARELFTAPGGPSVIEIAAELGTTRNAVIGIAFRKGWKAGAGRNDLRGLPGVPRRGRGWGGPAPERPAHHRPKIERGGERPAGYKPPPVSLAGTGRADPHPAPLNATAGNVAAAFRSAAADQPGDHGPKSLMELRFATNERAADCRWPLGDWVRPTPERDCRADPSATMFCGAAAIDGKPYCDEHCKRAFTGTTTTRWEPRNAGRRTI